MLNICNGKCGDAVQWELNENGKLLISGKGKMYDYSEGEAPWYANRAAITDIEIQEGITRIGDRAFAGLKKLKNLSIPESVLRVGENAFQDAFGEQVDLTIRFAGIHLDVIFNKGNIDLFHAIIKAKHGSLYAKMIALFNKCLSESGYEEPVYHEVKVREHKELPFYYLTTFYDEHGVIRKQYDVPGSDLREIRAYDENGDIIAEMYSGVEVSRGLLRITMYISTGKFEIRYGCRGRLRKKTTYAISMIDGQIQKY